MTTPTSIKAIRAAKSLSEAKKICADMRLTVLAVEKKFGLGHATTKAFNASYDNAVDEMAFIFGRTTTAAA